jgi:hypothetical protein
MTMDDYFGLDDHTLKEKIRALPREALDSQLRQFGSQHALLCQRLEALYSPDRLDRFIAIRPGGLVEIDKVLKQTPPDNAKERALLEAFRELNRILLPFMDIYEERVLADLQYMSEEDLKTLYRQVSEELTSAQQMQKENLNDFRQVQNASGTLRLGRLIQDGIRGELKNRFGVILEE